MLKLPMYVYSYACLSQVVCLSLCVCQLPLSLISFGDWQLSTTTVTYSQTVDQVLDVHRQMTWLQVTLNELHEHNVYNMYGV